MSFRVPSVASLQGKWGVVALALLVPGSFVVLPALWLLRRWDSADASERYLAGSASLAELERRMRVLDRGGGGPAFVTFNH